MEETQPTSGGSKMPLIIIGVIVVLAVLGFAGMKVLNKSKAPAANSAMEMTAEPTTAGSSATTTTAPTGVMGAETSDEKVITMEAGSFYYSVKTIDVKKGQKVKIVMTGKDMMHNLNIDELNVHSDTIKAGESTTIEFTADKVGTFEYYCSVGQHRKMGQVGKITVS